MIWFTADLHLGHEAIIELAKRPFGGVSEMNEVLIANINDKVGEGDELWILGDASCRIPQEEAAGLLGRIRCRNLHLVRGNHDKKWEGPGVFSSVQDYKELKAQGKKLVLFHYPILEWNGYRHDWSIHLHGHIHSSADVNALNALKGRRAFDVGVDANGYRPVSLEEALSFFEGVKPFAPEAQPVVLDRKALPFYFVVEFSEVKAAENGYSVESLLKQVDEDAAYFGMTRTAEGRWDALYEDWDSKREALHGALGYFSMRRWFVVCAKKWVYWNDERPRGCDMLAERAASPLRLL